MSTTMPATAGHSQACCNVPPVVVSGYETKGTYEELGGYKTYVTGAADADKGIVVVYDIFGYRDQTLQGADILAAGGGGRPYRVFVPDLFRGDACPLDWYPPDTPEKQQKLGAWFGKWKAADTAANLPAYLAALREANPGVKSWGILGYCWGGKVVCLATSSADNAFAAGASCHPASLDAADAKGVRVPLVLLASKDEDPAEVAAFDAALAAAPKHVETFADQVHGWMAARADLADPRVRDEYARGYKTVLEFFHKHWN